MSKMSATGARTAGVPPLTAPEQHRAAMTLLGHRMAKPVELIENARRCKMKGMKALLWAALLLSSVTAALSQPLEIGIHGGVSRLSNNNIGNVQTQLIPTDTPTQPVTLRDGFRFGFRLTLNSQVYTGHELGYAYNRTTLRFYNDPASDQGMAIHQGFYNYLGYLTKEGKRIRPFATAGVHFNTYVPPGASVSSGGGTTKFGINYGGGIKALVSSKYAIRVDFRQYQNGKPFDLPGNSGWLKMNEISAGFSLVL